MIFFFPVRKLRAEASGVYPSSAMARYTFSFVSLDTYRVLLMVWDTVAVDTPASFATSLMVTFMGRPPYAMVPCFTQTISPYSIGQAPRRVKTFFCRSR